MATLNVDARSEIESWLKTVLEKENLKCISVADLGTSEVGDGYLGDIVFASVSGKTEDGSAKEYNFVLKCSKRSQALRESALVQVYMNEIFVYDQLFPSFAQFEKDKDIETPFDSVPKCYGTFVGDQMEVIVLENLKKIGYKLWPKRESLTRSHIDMVIKEYSKFHAISVAMKHQQPDKFQELINTFDQNKNIMLGFGRMDLVFASYLEEAYELLKKELDEKFTLKLKHFSEQVNLILAEMNDNTSRFKVFTHGDCWNNNFMFKYNNDDSKTPTKVAILDWQIARYSTLIFDLSYFLFACISKDDVKDIGDILSTYHKACTNHLKRLGVEESNELYPFQQFLDDWNKYCKQGILMATLVAKVCSSEKDEVKDIARSADDGKDFSQTFMVGLKNTDHFKNRMRLIVEYAATHDLI
ncbi:hypothetical protein MTP99_001680 [Tenebrio molitor]|nr:hypothetical protein MTP99_001680 [Tenebrio molitor]